MSGTLHAFLWNVTNHIVKTFHNIFSSTSLYNSYFTLVPLHAVYNIWLVPVTACGSQSTACCIGFIRDKPSIGVNCIIEEHNSFWELINVLMSSQNIYFKLEYSKSYEIYNKWIISLMNVSFACKGSMPVTRIPTMMNLLKAGMNLLMVEMNPSKQGER